MPLRFHHRVLVTLRELVRRRTVEYELDEELRFHLEQLQEDEMAHGSAPAQAQMSARRLFGGVDQAKEACRDMRTLQPLEELLRDVGFGGRLLLRNPAFATVSILSLAVAIGANTVMLSVLNAVLLRPLPFRSPEQLMMVWTGSPGRNPQGRPAYWTVEEWRRRNTSFADMAVLDPVSVTRTDADGAERTSVVRTSPNVFALLGVQPVQGRTFSDKEAEDRERVVVISDRFWRSRLGTSHDAIGASIVLNGLPSRVIGILPARLEVPFAADVWEPHTMFPDWEVRRRARNEGSWLVVGRLRPGVTIDRAQADMTAVSRALDDQVPVADRNRGASVVPLSLYVVGPGPRVALWTLAGAVFCVLLIAAANVASLSLARSVGRVREFATRESLGANRARIVRQMLAEGVTLAFVSGVLGTVMALGGIRLVRAIGPGDLARLNEVSLDLRVLVWTLASSGVMGLLVGLAPAVAASRRKLWSLGEASGRSVSAGLATRRIRRAFVVAECALTVMLMAGAGLLVRSWWNVTRVDPGFRSDRILSIQLSTTAFESPAQRLGFYESALEEIRSLPGIESVGIIGDLYVSGDAERLVTPEGNAGNAGNAASAGGVSERVRLRVDEVSAGLFTTLGTPLIRGRFFAAADGPDAPRVAIVNETMGRRVWPGSSPVGRRFRYGPPESTGPWITVVGLVGDMRRQGLEIDPIPQIFEPLAQNPSALETLLVRTSSDDPLETLPAIRAALGRLDRRAPLYGVTTLTDRLEASRAQRRFQTALLLAFALVAQVMAAIGIYGLIHYSVATRTHEIGLRMALGARARNIFQTIVREGLQLSVTGLVLGLVGAFWMGRAASSLLFRVTPADPITLVMVCVLLAGVALAACYFPARRAMKLEPVEALRRT